MGPIAIVAGVLCVGVFILNALVRPRSDAALIALALLGSWAVYTFLASINPWPTNLRLFALVDLVVGLTCWLSNRTRPATWKRVLYWLMAAQIIWHALFWIGMEWADKSRQAGMMLRYTIGLNVLGFAQIALGAWPGVSDVSGRLRAWLSGDPTGRYPVGS